MKRVLAAAPAAGVLAGCGSTDEEASTRPLNVFPASFDLAVDRPARFLVGLSTVGNRLVSGGSVLGDIQDQVVNEAAAVWLVGGSLHEPWVFPVSEDGRVLARWDNVATREEIEPLLRDLPPTR
jgi:hypothetical protein